MIRKQRCVNAPEYVYLLHFSAPLSGHAMHYIGYCKGEPDMRLDTHRSGRGARLPRAVALAGIEMHIARVWTNGSRRLERSLKNQKNARRFCPTCWVERLFHHKEETL